MKRLITIFLHGLFSKAAEVNMPDCCYLIVKDQYDCNAILRIIMDTKNLDTLCNLEMMLDKSVSKANPYYNTIALEIFIKKQSFARVPKQSH